MGEEVILTGALPFQGPPNPYEIVRLLEIRSGHRLVTAEAMPKGIWVNEKRLRRIVHTEPVVEEGADGVSETDTEGSARPQRLDVPTEQSFGNACGSDDGGTKLQRFQRVRTGQIER